jgi:hypothetical protein
VDQRRQDPGPAGAERMAEGDGAAINVYPLTIETQLPYTGDDLHRKRLVQFHEIELVNRDHQQWAKNADGFAPCGPWIVTADELDVRGGLTMRRYLNGELLSESSTSEMRRQPWEIAAFISEFSTLLPGDLIPTGTPPTGPCNAGDVIEGEVEGIGTLRARLVEREVDPQWQAAFTT